jgi:hypothetical protein
MSKLSRAGSQASLLRPSDGPVDDQSLVVDPKDLSTSGNVPDLQRPPHQSRQNSPLSAPGTFQAKQLGLKFGGVQPDSNDPARLIITATDAKGTARTYAIKFTPALDSEADIIAIAKNTIELAKEGYVPGKITATTITPVGHKPIPVKSLNSNLQTSIAAILQTSGANSATASQAPVAQAQPSPIADNYQPQLIQGPTGCDALDILNGYSPVSILPTDPDGTCQLHAIARSLDPQGRDKDAMKAEVLKGVNKYRKLANQDTYRDVADYQSQARPQAPRAYQDAWDSYNADAWVKAQEDEKGPTVRLAIFSTSKHTVQFFPPFGSLIREPSAGEEDADVPRVPDDLSIVAIEHSGNHFRGLQVSKDKLLGFAKCWHTVEAMLSEISTFRPNHERSGRALDAAETLNLRNAGGTIKTFLTAHASKNPSLFARCCISQIKASANSNTQQKSQAVEVLKTAAAELAPYQGNNSWAAAFMNALGSP